MLAGPFSFASSPLVDLHCYNGDNINQDVTIPSALGRGTISSSPGSWMSWSVNAALLSRGIPSWRALCPSHTFGGCITRHLYRRWWTRSLFPVQTAHVQGSSKFLAGGYREMASWVEGCPHWHALTQTFV